MIRFRPLPVLTVWTLIGIALLCGLGQWQIYRLHWKLGLIAAAQTRSHAPPVPLQSLLDKPERKVEYTHAETQGTFIAGQRAYLFSQLEDGRIGFQVLEPLRLADGRVLIVDRGFVPQGDKDMPAASAPAPTGATQIEGLVRGEQKPNLFTAPTDPKNKIFYVRDIPAIAAAMGVSGALPVMLAEDRTGPPGTYPEGGHTKLTFRNEHLQYAVTWFSLAFVLLVMYFVYHKNRGRLSFGPRK